MNRLEILVPVGWALNTNNCLTVPEIHVACFGTYSKQVTRLVSAVTPHRLLGNPRRAYRPESRLSNISKVLCLNPGRLKRCSGVILFSSKAHSLPPTPTPTFFTFLLLVRAHERWFPKYCRHPPPPPPLSIPLKTTIKNATTTITAKKKTQTNSQTKQNKNPNQNTNKIKPHSRKW